MTGSIFFWVEGNGSDAVFVGSTKETKLRLGGTP